MEPPEDCDPVALEDTVPRGPGQRHQQRIASSPPASGQHPHSHSKPMTLLLSRLRSTLLDVEQLLGGDVQDDQQHLVTPYLAGDDTVRFLPTSSDTLDSVDSRNGRDTSPVPAFVASLSTERRSEGARTLLLGLMKSNMLAELMPTITGEAQAPHATTGKAPTAADGVDLEHISTRVDAVFTWLLCTQLMTHPTTALLFSHSSEATTTSHPSQFSSNRRDARGSATTTHHSKPHHASSTSYRSFCASTDLHLLDVLESAAKLIQELVVAEEAAASELHDLIAAANDFHENAGDDDEVFAALGQAEEEHKTASSARMRLLWVLFCSIRIALGCRHSAHWELTPPSFTTAGSGEHSQQVDQAAVTCSSLFGGCTCFQTCTKENTTATAKTSSVLAACMDTGLLSFLVRRWASVGRAQRLETDDVRQPPLLLEEFHGWLGGAMTLGLVEQLLCCLGRDMDHHRDEVGLLLQHLYSVDSTMFPSNSHNLEDDTEGDSLSPSGPLPLMLYLSELMSRTSGRHDQHSVVSGQLAARVLSLCIVLFRTAIQMPLQLSRTIIREAVLRLSDAAALVKAEDNNGGGGVGGHGAHHGKETQHPNAQRERWRVDRGAASPVPPSASITRVSSVIVPRERHGHRDGNAAAHSPYHRRSGNDVVVGSSDAAPTWSSTIRCSTIAGHSAPPPEALLLVAVLFARQDAWTVETASTFSCKSLVASPLFTEWVGAAALLLASSMQGGTVGVTIETLTFSVMVVPSAPVTSIPVNASVGVMDEVPPLTSAGPIIASSASPLVAIPHPAHPSKYAAVPSLTIRAATPLVSATPHRPPQRVTVVCEATQPQVGGHGVTVLSRISGQAPAGTSSVDASREGSGLPWSFGVATLPGTTKSSTSPETRTAITMGLCPDGPLVAKRLQRRLCELYFFSPTANVAPLHGGDVVQLSLQQTVTVAVCAVNCADVGAYVDASILAVSGSGGPAQRSLFSDDGAYAPLRPHQRLVGSTCVTGAASSSWASPRGRSDAARGASSTPGLNDPPERGTTTSVERSTSPPSQKAIDPSTAAASDQADQSSAVVQLASELEASRQEVRELRELLAQKNQANDKLQLRLETSDEQRQHSMQRLSDLRLELELCQTEMVGPLRLETSKLRKQLQLKEQDLQIVVDAVHTLALDNEVLASHLLEVQGRLEKGLR